MLLSKLLLLPFAVASTVTVYVHSVPAPEDSKSPLPSPIPLAQIEYDASTSTASLASYTPPTGSYTPDHFLRIGLADLKASSWRGVVTAASSFAEQYKKKFVIHIDEKGEPYHVGFGTSARGSGEEVEVEVVKRAVGAQPALNKPIVLNADGKVESKEPEKSFIQKWVLPAAYVILVQLTDCLIIDTGGPSRFSFWCNSSPEAERGSKSLDLQRGFSRRTPSDARGRIITSSKMKGIMPFQSGRTQSVRTTKVLKCRRALCPDLI